MPGLTLTNSMPSSWRRRRVRRAHATRPMTEIRTLGVVSLIVPVWPVRMLGRLLEATRMPNNIAFNVKVVPAANDSHAQVVDRMSAYAAAYFEVVDYILAIDVGIPTVGYSTPGFVF